MKPDPPDLTLPVNVLPELVRLSVPPLMLTVKDPDTMPWIVMAPLFAPLPPLAENVREAPPD